MSKVTSQDFVALQLLIKLCLSEQATSLQEVQRVKEQKLYQLAQWHGVRNLLFANVTTDIISEQFYQQLQAGATRATFQALFQTNSLTDLWKAFQQAQIPCYAYKGIVWSYWLYNDLNTRSSGDIDLLVPPQHFAKALKVAQELGYKLNDYWAYLLSCKEETIQKAFYRTDYHIPLTHENGLTLELHWQPAYTRLAFAFPAEEWFEWKKEIVFQNRQLVMFQNEYQLLLLIMHHGGKERWDQLKYIADLVAYLHRYSAATDWDLVLHLAKQKGMLNLVHQAIGLVNELIPDHRFVVPLSLRKQKVNLTPFLQKWDKMETPPENSTWPYFKHGIQMRDGVQHRWKVLKEHLHYFTEIRLLSAKAKWYRKQESKG